MERYNMKEKNPVKIIDSGFERVMCKYYGKNWRELPPNTKPTL